jgi:hypothetical protein
MKKCPFCAEKIQDEAIKCKHCQSMLSNNEKNEKGIDEIPQESHEESEVKAKSGVMDGVRIGAGIFIVLPLIIIGILCFLGTALYQISNLFSDPVVFCLTVVGVVFLFWYLSKRKNEKKEQVIDGASNEDNVKSAEKYNFKETKDLL